MKNSLFLIFVLNYCCLVAQTPSLEWVEKIGGVSSDIGNSITVDATGNIYTAGYFNGTVDFDPGTGTTNITASGSSDIFISKLNSDGNFIWAVGIGGSGADIGNSIKTDALGNVYVTGYFSGTVDFNPGGPVDNLISMGGEEIFILKLDASGNYNWAKQLGGTGNDAGKSISVDLSGAVFTTGYFSNTADFDPGVPVSNLNSAGSYDIFVCKLDASGNLAWAKQMGGGTNDIGNALTLDLSGNVYTTGHFSTTADFDPGVGTSNLNGFGAGDVFISKLDASGNFSWAKQLGGTANDVGNGLALDAVGNIYCGGYFFNTGDFDPGIGTFILTSAGVGDNFVTKLNSSGNFCWARNTGSTLDDFVHALEVDASGDVYTTGYFAGSADFDPGVGTYFLYSYFTADSSLIRDQIFVSKLDSAGNFSWAAQLGGVKGYGLALAENSIYTTGFFTSTADFDPMSTTFNLTTNGSDDIYVHKLNQNWAGINTDTHPNLFQIYPNPAAENITIVAHKIPNLITITDIQGTKILEVIPISKNSVLTISNFVSGIYFVQVTFENEFETIRVLKL
ncbi:MAG: SBBP repeat-containing protein [Bacteroidetes bacterium]|nr:SBBP repeat-containing protein [Bacteroidota bacterium]